MKENIVYIAGPMTGFLNYNNHTFYFAEQFLKKRGYETRSTAVLPHDWTSYEDYMTVAFAMLSTAGKICFLPKSEKSAGAMRELQYAVKHDIDVIEPFTDEEMATLVMTTKAADREWYRNLTKDIDSLLEMNLKRFNENG